MQNKTLAVGITGGIGSGKSLICKIFEALGVPVYYADYRAKWLQTHDPKLIQLIKEQFGLQAYNEQGDLNRTFLAEQVFNNEEKLKLLNNLVHPRVAEDFLLWQKKHVDSPYTIKEAALLFETGSYKSLQKIINVNAPVELRIKRVMLRDTHRSRQQILAIMAKQWQDEERTKIADFNINNDENSLIVPEVLGIHETLVRLNEVA